MYAKTAQKLRPIILLRVIVTGLTGIGEFFFVLDESQKGNKGDMSTRAERSADKTQNERHTKILKELMQRPDNRRCADCRKKGG
jgi:hypothetical protein